MARAKFYPSSNTCLGTVLLNQERRTCPTCPNGIVAIIVDNLYEIGNDRDLDASVDLSIFAKTGQDLIVKNETT